MRKINVKGQANTGAIRVIKNSSVTIKNVDLECIKAEGQEANMYGRRGGVIWRNPPNNTHRPAHR